MLRRFRERGGAVTWLTMLCFAGALQVPIVTLAQSGPQGRVAKVLFVPTQRAETVPETVPGRAESYLKALLQIDPTIRLLEAEREVEAPAPEPVPVESPPPTLVPISPNANLEKAARMVETGEGLVRAGRYEKALSVLLQARTLYEKNLADLESFDTFVDLLAWIAAAFLKGGFLEEGADALNRLLTVRPEFSPDPETFGSPFVEAVASARKRLKDGPSLLVVANPATAAIYVDGRLVGAGTQTVSGLKAGVHYIRVVEETSFPKADIVTLRGTAPVKRTLSLKTRLLGGGPKVATRPVTPGPARDASLGELIRRGEVYGPQFQKAAKKAADAVLADFVMVSFVARTEGAFHLGVFLHDARTGQTVGLDSAIMDSDLGNLQVAMLELEGRISQAVANWPADRVVTARPAIFDLRVARPAVVAAPAPPAAVASAPAPTPGPTPSPVVASTPTPAPTPAPAALPPAAPVSSQATAPRGGFDEIPEDFPMETLAPAPAKKPVYKQWWLWTVVGAVVVGGATAAGVLLGRSGGQNNNLSGQARW